MLRIIAQDISAQICKGNGGHGVSWYGQNLHPVSGRVLGDQKDAVGLSPRSRCFRLCQRFPPVDPHAQNGFYIGIPAIGFSFVFDGVLYLSVSGFPLFL